MYVCAHLGAGKVGKYWIGKDSKWGRRKKLIEGREEETEGGETGHRGKKDEMSSGAEEKRDDRDDETREMEEINTARE